MRKTRQAEWLPERVYSGESGGDSLRFGDFYVKLKCSDIYLVLLFLLHIFYEQADISEKWEGERKENCTDKIKYRNGINSLRHTFSQINFLSPPWSLDQHVTRQCGTRALSITRVPQVALDKWTQILPASIWFLSMEMWGRIILPNGEEFNSCLAAACHLYILGHGGDFARPRLSSHGLRKLTFPDRCTTQRFPWWHLQQWG